MSGCMRAYLYRPKSLAIISKMVVAIYHMPQLQIVGANEPQSLTYNAVADTNALPSL